MKVEEIIKNNKIIAEFMGGLYNCRNYDKDDKHVILYQSEMWLPVHGICRHDTINTGSGNILEYHKSWDWLMPVVSKIRNISKPTIEESLVMIALMNVEIESLYKEVVECIESYKLSN